MRILNTILAFSVVGLVSCKKELEPQQPMYTYNDSLAAAPATNAALTPAPAVNPAAVTTSVATPAAASAPVTVAPGMNPPHGQPNHRCDIAVGAPLNSPAAKAPAAAPKTTVQTINPGQGAATVVAGTNPPHGQPNHRCDIAVGAPLPKNDTAGNTPAVESAEPDKKE